MDLDKKYRAFMLGMAAPETEADVEEEIFDGRIDPDRLQQIEEELIDDSLFGGLSEDENRAFKSEFLTSPRRVDKVLFARELRHHALRYAPEVGRRTTHGGLRKLARMFWALSVAGAFGCAVLAIVWLGERDLMLNHQLAQASRADDAHQRVIASMVEERKRQLSEAASAESTPYKPALTAALGQFPAPPSIRLSPGVSRGLSAIPVLRLNPQATVASIVLDLPFVPEAPLREELLSFGGTAIWSQQFSTPSGLSNHKTATVVLPAALLPADDYQLRVESGTQTDTQGEVATYLFRVRRD